MAMCGVPVIQQVLIVVGRTMVPSLLAQNPLFQAKSYFSLGELEGGISVFERTKRSGLNNKFLTKGDRKLPQRLQVSLEAVRAIKAFRRANLHAN